MRFSNMSSKLSLLLLIICLFTSLQASETRVATMGSNGMYIKDNSNIMLYPGLLLTYSDYVIAELRPNAGFNSQQNYSLGIHMDYGNMASALYINQPINSMALSAGLDAFDTYGINLNSELNNAYVFMFALELGGFDAGFGLATAGTSVDNGTVEETASYIAVLAGISNERLDAGLKIELPSIEVSNGGTIEYSAFALTAYGRYDLMTLNDAKIVPVGMFSIGSGTFKNGTEADASRLAFAAGIGVEKPLNEQNIFIVGLDAFGYDSQEIDAGAKLTTTTVTLPAIYVGVESRIADWLLGRVGVRHTNVSITREQEGANDITNDGSTFNLALGLGMEFGNFLLDFGINEGLLFDGPYIFSHQNGASDPSGSTNQFASKISITYNFGGEDVE